MAIGTHTVLDACRGAQTAARDLVQASTQTKNDALSRLAALLRQRGEAILEANAADLAGERAVGLSAALRDRLELTPARIEAMASGVEEVAALADPVGEELERRTLRSGVELRKVRVPLGVVAVIYEARPNVTVDCAALCLKSGNAIVLRGSSYAQQSNAVLAELVREALADVGLPLDAVSMLSGERAELAELATAEGLVDLVIPRGGEGLKAALKELATVPVLYAAAGNCHVYVHDDADLDMATRIVVNAKTQRPGVCNAAETVLVHTDAAGALLPRLAAELTSAGVELRGDEYARLAAGDGAIREAAEEDWDTEFHDLTLVVGVVPSLSDAIDHVNRHGTHHSDAIVTSSAEAAEEFTTAVDSACVYVNASTRFTDGFEFGMGAEIGNSTEKLHARGPIGLRELTTYKYVLHGNGQIRE